MRQRGLRIQQPAQFLPQCILEIGARVLPVEAAHAYAMDRLPSIHRDPFDRLLVAQAFAEDLPLLTSDAMIRQYPVRVVW